MLTEKVLFKNRAINSLILEEHWDHKRRNGYSEMEIANKREALENRLIPFHPEENLAMLEKAGFTDPAIIFASGPFQLYLAIK
jgi:tRNA (cmo5U34)-methyltransferase